MNIERIPTHCGGGMMLILWRSAEEMEARLRRRRDELERAADAVHFTREQKDALLGR